MVGQTTATELSEFVPAIVAFFVATAAIVAVRALLRRRGDDRRPEWRWQVQAWTFVLSALGVIAVLLTLPAGALDKQTVLSVLGLALTAVIALSASTIVANAMSGLMLHSVGNFRPGDFIHVGEHFGRVTERGLFHTELQTEDGDLTALPNSVLVSQAIKVVRSTGTVVSAQVSLGYDVSRSRVEEALLGAAEAVELEEPFVHVTDLGDFSVSYRIAGFLRDVKRILNVRSRLRSAVLDHLHAAGIEIVSPAFMNQRIVDPATRFIPLRTGGTSLPADEMPEALVFDKAERAGRIEELRDRREALAGDLDALESAIREADAAEAERLERRRAAVEQMIEHIDYLSETLRAGADDG